MASAADLTLDELRLELAPEIALAAIFDGWSDAAVVSASKVAGVDPAVARLAFPDGAMDMIAAWVASVDARMEAAFDGGVLAQMPVRERIRALGIDEGAQVAIAHRGVFGGHDPIALSIGRMTLAVRRAHAAAMTVREL